MDDVMFRNSALDGRLQIKRIPLFFCVKRNFALPYGFFIFSLHWILLLYLQISAALNNTTISETSLCSANCPLFTYTRNIQGVTGGTEQTSGGCSLC